MIVGTSPSNSARSHSPRVPPHAAASISPASAGEGGYVDPLERPFDEVLEDVSDEDVSI